jgi:hypothetical protein
MFFDNISLGKDRERYSGLRAARLCPSVPIARPNGVPQIDCVPRTDRFLHFQPKFRLNLRLDVHLALQSRSSYVRVRHSCQPPTLPSLSPLIHRALNRSIKAKWPPPCPTLFPLLPSPPGLLSPTLDRYRLLATKRMPSWLQILKQYYVSS